MQTFKSEGTSSFQILSEISACQSFPSLSAGCVSVYCQQTSIPIKSAADSDAQSVADCAPSPWLITHLMMQWKGSRLSPSGDQGVVSPRAVVDSVLNWNARHKFRPNRLIVSVLLERISSRAKLLGVPALSCSLPSCFVFAAVVCVYWAEQCFFFSVIRFHSSCWICVLVNCRLTCASWHPS